jgi:hypothetical protein
MRNRPSSPRWWVLYTVLPLTMGLFVLEVRAPGSPIRHKLEELGIVFFAFTYVGVWVGANALAFLQQDRQKPEHSRQARPLPQSDLRSHVTPQAAAAARLQLAADKRRGLVPPEPKSSRRIRVSRFWRTIHDWIL